MTTDGRARSRRAIAVGLLVLALAMVAAFVGLSAIALIAPYTSVVVPPDCAQALEAVNPGGTIDIPGHGPGTLLAATGDRAVAVSIDSTLAPRPTAAYLVDQSASRVLWEILLGSDAVVAAIDDGIVFLWDDKIGYTVSASTGELLGALVRSDNYRGIFRAPDGRRLQLDVEVTAFGLGGAPISHHTFPLVGVVDGCVFGR